MNEIEKARILNGKDRERTIERIELLEEINAEKELEVERLNSGLNDIKWFIEKNKTSFSDLFIPASDVVCILNIIDRLLGSDKE